MMKGSPWILDYRGVKSSILTKIGAITEKKLLATRLLTAATVFFLIFAGSPLANSNIESASAGSNPYVPVGTLDEIAPTTSISLSGPTGNNDWYMGHITVTLAAADDEGGSGVAVTEYALDGTTWLSYSGSFIIANEGITTISYRSTDKAGNIEETQTQTVNIDKTPPHVTINTPAGEYLLNQQVLADWSADDAVSGIALATGTIPKGSAIDTTSVGTKTFEVTASDNSGNPVTKTVSYHVRYHFAGFFKPIDNFPILNTVQAGSAVPIKFSLSGYQSLNIFEANYPKSSVISCELSTSFDAIDGTVTDGGRGLFYNASLDQYNYVWKTDKTWAGSCRQLVVKLIDGSDHQALLRFFK